AGVEKLVFEFLAAPAAVGLDEIPIRELALRILVEVFHVRMRRRTVDVEVVLLHVLAVVALAVGQAEQPLLEDRVALVPERDRKAQPLLVVGDAPEAILPPSVRARARLVVREVAPGIAVLAVVLADGAPLPLTEVGAPFLPRRAGFPRLVQAFLFRNVQHVQFRHMNPFSESAVSPPVASAQMSRTGPARRSTSPARSRRFQDRGPSHARCRPG